MARALSQRGMTAEVVERAHQWQPAGTGLYLPANAVRALFDLGLEPGLRQRASQVHRQRMLTHRGRVLADLDVRRIWGDVGDCLAIHRTDLHRMLREAVAEVPIRMGTTVTDIGEAGTVTFDDGSADRYDLIIGADGINSTVRRLAAIDNEPRFVGQLCWRFVAHGVDGIKDWTARLGPGGRTFLTVDLGYDRTYCYADVNSPRPQAPASDWRSLFADFAAPVPQLLEQGADAHFAALAEVGGSDWVRPAIVLIGDAAHACSPSMAQGGAMAVEDAIVLAEQLQEQPIEHALAAFRARRLHRVEWVFRQNHRRDKARNLPTTLRNLTLRLGAQRLFRANHAPLLRQP